MAGQAGAADRHRGDAQEIKVDDKLEKLSVADARRAVDFAEWWCCCSTARAGSRRRISGSPTMSAGRRALVVAINKWDVAEGPKQPVQRQSRRRSTRAEPGARGALMTVSGKTGKGIDNCSPPPSRSARPGRSESRPASSTAVRGCGREEPPPAPGGKRIKLRYITQVNTRPPSFVLFGTRVDQLPDTYLRYLVNGIRRELGFGAVPVRLQARASRKSVRRHRQELGFTERRP